MSTIKKIALLLLLILVITACKEDKKVYNMPEINPTRERQEYNSYDTIRNTLSPDTTRQLNADIGTVSTSSRYESERPNRHGYAERKKTDELEEEYYDAFGNNYLYDIDDEEYEAGEQEYDYDD